eukprot:8683638-Heterocapsa_arctica.AAC.1
MFGEETTAANGADTVPPLPSSGSGEGLPGSSPLPGSGADTADGGQQSIPGFTAEMLGAMMRAFATAQGA